MTTPFIIYGLPRSRTFWLSRFLTYGDWQCGHEEIRHARTLDDVRNWLSLPCAGTAETAGAPWWRLVQSMRPDARTVVVRRPAAEVVASLLRTGVEYDEARLRSEIRKLDAKLDQIQARVPGVLSVSFSDLESEATCARVFEHCLPYRHDPAWYALTAPMNLQANLQALTQYYQGNAGQLEKLGKIAKQTILGGLARALPMPDAFTFQQEPLSVALRDSDALVRDHCVQVGEAPDQRLAKNWSFLFTLERLGALQVMTARSNGRIFGYLLAIIGPSLEHTDRLEALHTTFFTSKDAPGLGLKLQRASIAALRDRGVHDVVLRAGPRGNGPRLGSLYRRLGAEDAGQMFILDLKGAA